MSLPGRGKFRLIRRVRRLLKTLARLMLGLALLLTLLAVTFPRWAPVAFDRGLPPLLRRFGVSDSSLVLREFSWSRLEVVIDRLSYRGVEVSNTGLSVDYATEGLSRGAADQVRIFHPEIVIDLEQWQATTPPPQPGESEPIALPRTLPLSDLTLENAAVTIVGGNWMRELAANARIVVANNLWGRVDVFGHETRLSARFFTRWPELSGRAQVALEANEPTEWVAFAQAGGWLTLPDDLRLKLGPATLDGDARFANQEAGPWTISAEAGQSEVGFGETTASLQRLNLTAQGNRAGLDSLAGSIAQGRVSHDPFDVQFDGMDVRVPQPDRVSLDWNRLTLSGKTPGDKPAPYQLQADTASMRATAPGPLGETPFNLEQWHAHLASGQLTYERLQLDFGEFATASSGPGAIDLALRNWRLSGATSVESVGAVSGELGDVALRLEGPWAVWSAPFVADEWGAQLSLLRSPVQFFTGLGSVTGDLSLEVNLSAGSPRRLAATAMLEGGQIVASAASFEADSLQLDLTGSLPGPVLGRVGVEAGNISWGEDAGSLAGLAGALNLASLQPLTTAGAQTLRFDPLAQGQFPGRAGEITVAFDASATTPLDAQLRAAALGGTVAIFIAGDPAKPMNLKIRARLERVRLEEIVALLPDFNGELSGEVSGDLTVELENKRIILSPGYLEMAAGTTGKFRYTQPGWLTGDPNLNPEKFVAGRDIVSVMQAPQGASIVTELALRDLTMTHFRLDVLEPGVGDRPVKAQIAGESLVKGITVPVVLEVPIRGDIKETLNLMLKFYEKM